jgi:hypothetical protein
MDLARDRHDDDIASRGVVTRARNDYGRAPLGARLVSERKWNKHNVSETKLEELAIGQIRS